MAHPTFLKMPLFHRILMTKLCSGQGWMVARRYAGVHPFPVIVDSIDSQSPSWQTAEKKALELIGEVEKLSLLCVAGGGEKGVATHVKKNKKVLVRDRLAKLFDEEDDFLELCLLAGIGMEYGDVPAAGSVCGIGKIHGHYCMVSANDATVKGGSYFPITVTKNLRSNHIATLNRLPSIYIVDSGGGFLPLQSELFPDKNHGGRAFYNEAVMSADGIPQIALVSGSCTAGGAYCPTMCEDSAIVDRVGTIFLGGPPLVKAATGEEVSAEDLGGAKLHSSVSGCSDYFAATEEEGISLLRDVVATLNIDQDDKSPNFEEPLYSTSDLDALCGQETLEKTDMYGIIARLVDGSRFRDFKKLYGKNLITGYALLEGRVIGVIANAGNLTYEDGLKGSHFVQLCQQRGMPIIFLQNSGNFGAAAFGKEPLESALDLKGKGTMMAAVSSATVPKISINVGGCHGDDNYTMCGASFNPNFNFAWPGVTVTHTVNPPPVPPPQKSEDEKNEERNKKVKKRPQLSAFNFPASSALFHASRTLIDGVIIPANTRKVVAHCLRICRQQQRTVLSPKNFPVFRM